MSTHRSHPTSVPHHRATADLTTPADLPRSTRRLLSLGVAAGPVGAVLIMGQLLTVEGFDARRHTISYLALGPSGGVQTLMFLLTGVLYALGAVGLRRALQGDRGGRWAPIFVAVLGVSFIWGGVFPMDPADGFPLGTPDGPAAAMSWHAALHQLAPMLASVALIGAAAVLARRSFGLRRWAVGVGCLLIIVLDLLPLAVAGRPAFFVVTTTTQLVAWVLLSVLLGIVPTMPARATGNVSR